MQYVLQKQKESAVQGKKAPRLKVNHLVMAQTLMMLRNGAVTAKVIADKTGVHVGTAQAWLRSLKDQGAVHIGSWLTDSKGRDAIPVYEWGNEPDEPKRCFTRAEISRRYRQRQQDKWRESV
jgi:ribosomal protein S25